MKRARRILGVGARHARAFRVLIATFAAATAPPTYRCR